MTRTIKLIDINFMVRTANLDSVVVVVVVVQDMFSTCKFM